MADVAGRQHGVVCARQLLGAGFSAEAIRHRVAVKRLRAVHAGVYSAVPVALTARGSYMAAVLACGEGAVLSHRCAAAMWDLRRHPTGRIDVTIRRGGSRHRTGVTIHTTRRLGPADITARDGIPCTSLARTLVDLAAVAAPRELRRALEQSLNLGVFDRGAIDTALAVANGRRGTANLRKLLDEMPDQPAPVRSELERRFLDIVRRADLPPPVVNARIGDHEVDFHWPDHRLIVETDGRAVHDSPHAFERDRRRDLDLELSGWHVLRLGWRQVVGEPQRVAALLAARLGATPKPRAARARRRAPSPGC